MNTDHSTGTSLPSPSRTSRAHPQIDFSLFRYRAVVDFVKLEITLNRQTQGRWIYEKFCCHSTPIDPETGSACATSATQLVTIQNPKSWSDVQTVIDGINTVWGVVSLQVKCVEIAFDAYKRSTEGDLATLVADMYMSLAFKATKPDGTLNQRLYNGQRAENALRGRSALTIAIRNGDNIGIGNTHDPAYQHLYLKTTDSASEGLICYLPLNEHRARYEVRLQGTGLPSAIWGDWKAFRFESLSRYFEFRCMPTDGLMGVIRDASPDLALDRVRDRRDAHGKLKQKDGLKHARGSRASPLNEKARGALRDLSVRWGK